MLDMKFVLDNLDTVQKALDDKKAANEHASLQKLPGPNRMLSGVISQCTKDCWWMQ